MNYTIKNEKLKIEISSLGAELQSIKSSNGNEYLWQGNPEYWSGRAYNLFPICCRLFDGKYIYNNQEYIMNSHGFIRKSELSVNKIDENTIEFIYYSNDESYYQYPFKFIYKVVYKLLNNTLNITYYVENTDNKDIIFAVGAHPGFNVPLNKNENFEDYYLEFDNVNSVFSHVLSETCFMTAEKVAFNMEDGKKIYLNHSLFDNDAIVLSGMDKVVSLKSKKSNVSIKFHYPDMKYLGIWHTPHKDAPYVCIEPWSSVPSIDGIVDDLTTKKEMITLPIGGKYTNNLKLEIFE